MIFLMIFVVKLKGFRDLGVGLRHYLRIERELGNFRIIGLLYDLYVDKTAS